MRNYAGSAMMLVATMVAAVGCYTINLRVSSERAEVNSLRYQLVADAREMRNLQAELRTRARFPELQRWNDNVLQMSAPAAGQFLRSPVELASYAAAPAADSGVIYAVTGPETTVPRTAPITAPLVEVAYHAPVSDAAPAARLIRAGYTVPQRPPAPAIDLAPAAPRAEPPVMAARPVVRAQLARAESALEPGAATPSRPATKRPTPPRAAPPKVAAPDKAEAPDVGTPIDLLPQGGQ